VPEIPHDEETTPETGNDDGRAQGQTNPDTIGLVVLWSSDEPDHIGAWLPIATADGSGMRVLGRGPARPDDQHPRLSILRQRPGENQLLSPFGGEALSRSQLSTRPIGPERLEIVNLGRRKLFSNGVMAERHEIGPGDVLEIGTRMTLLCSKRPARLVGSITGSSHAFGHADEHGLVGESRSAWQLRSDIAFASRRVGHVLILGETGTGKDLVAGAIHALSSSSGPLISRNAATLPVSLVDAELFGNPKGYPNPGVPERAGLVGAAHRGSLFLDEFADLPSEAQAHLLRVLDSGEYQRLGETQLRRSEFRLIAATNKPESSLRGDLLARFDFRIRAPELARRREDIPLIFRHLFTLATEGDPELKRFCLPNGLPKLGVGFIRRLVGHPFRANVRELRQLVWRSIAESPGSALEWPEMTDRPDDPVAEGDALEFDEVQRVLDANNGSLDKTWRALGLSSRYVLRRLIAKHGLVVRRQGGTGRRD
jgi:two-component system nitrogen regulation response regulator GlnG/two-component system response regulator HydG